MICFGNKFHGLIQNSIYIDSLFMRMMALYCLANHVIVMEKCVSNFISA